VFKARLDGALSTLVWWKGSLPVAGGWNEMVCKVPSNPNHSMIVFLDVGTLAVIQSALTVTLPSQAEIKEQI